METLSAAALQSYQAARKLPADALPSLCYAPFSSLYFDTSGAVRACCHNFAYPVGNIQTHSLDEIWNGERIKTLRRALQKQTFGPGCSFCENRTRATFANAPMLRFDEYSVTEDDPPWPQQMEFSISNVCNLECVMCRGQWSSAIRSRREKLPPLPRLYEESFFASFWKYLPHLKRMKMLGGEPFLISEYYRLWNRMISDGLPIPCHITTNGTQYNQGVERIMEHIPISVALSLDSVTEETHSKIRINADFKEVIKNAERFRSYARTRNTSFSITFCLMRVNWHEFGQFCRLGDLWECSVGINTVINPPEFGIYSLPVDELRRVHRAMEKEAPRWATELKKNRSVWFSELDRIRAQCVLAA